MKPRLLKKLLSLAISVLAAAILNAQTTTPLDDFILNYMKDNKLPGVGIAIVKGGKLVLAKGYGYADIDKDIPYTANTIQEIASLSKPVTATALMKLWEQGVFQLDEPIDSYLPFTVRNPNFPEVPITFRMLMNHTSSIVGSHLGVGGTHPGAAMPLGIFLQNFLSPGGSLYNASENYEKFAPGTQYQYSNIAYALQGYLVEKISGMPFNEYCNKNIFQPLCMSNTRWYYSELDTNVVARPYKRNSPSADYDLYEIPDYPSGGLKTTVLDMSRFMLMHGSYGILDGVRIIDSTTEVMMRRHEILLRDDSLATAFEGLGWQSVHDYSINKDFFGKTGDHPGVFTRSHYNITDDAASTVFTNVRVDLLPIFFKLDQVVKDTISTTGKPDLNCSYLPYACEQNSDYWKNHQPQWPINSVPMKLGLVHYYSVNQVLDLLNRPDNGDASIVLAKALITAKFNIAQGSELEPIVLTVNSSMNLIGKHRVPYDVSISFSSPTGIQMLNLAATLNSYNSGSLNTTPCSGTFNSVTQARMERFTETKNSYSLLVFPNPASTSISIAFSLPKQEKVSIRIFDSNGRLVSTIADRNFAAGEHQLKWESAKFNSGAYVVRLQSQTIIQTKKLVVIK